MTVIHHSFSHAQQAIKELAAIDYFLAKEMLVSLQPKPEHQAVLQHLFFALSASLRAGHSCLSLTEIANSQWGNTSDANDKQSDAQISVAFPDLSTLNTLLTELNVSEEDQQLIVLKDNKLYLRRYFQFETELTQFINQRLNDQSGFNVEQVAQTIGQLFAQNTTSLADENLENWQTLDWQTLDWQKIAVANAINKNFSVIAGGPGTGKTYTVTKLLAALAMLQSLSVMQDEKTNKHEQLNIALVAPTGKAAQRLSESIANAVAGFQGLIPEEILAVIPSNAQTIHRLLGVIPNTPNFKHDQNNLLPYDIVLIDEVSMVDLPLMTRIFRALKADAKVILLGDADQLPSVATGSVLADIAPRPHYGYSEANVQYLSRVCQLPDKAILQSFGQQSATNTDYLTFLVKSRRFDGQGGIGLIANAVIAGDSRLSWQLLTDANNESRQETTSQLQLAKGDLGQWLKPLVKQYYQAIEHCSNVVDAFDLLAKFRVLCATRQGEYGVENINEQIKLMLGKRRFLQRHGATSNMSQHLYHGQPIMISENDYTLGLYNGDIGLIWQVTSSDGSIHLLASFQDESSGEPNIKQILPSRLPKFETVYAMTIHKTQGSEFNHVAMAISPPDVIQNQSKLLTRELLYTGITRAKSKLTIASHPQTWLQGVNSQVKRNSGLVIASSS